MGHVEGFHGYPWDNPALYEAEEIRKRMNGIPTQLPPKEEHKGLSDKDLLEHYKKVISNVESYLVCTIKNMWSLMQKKPRSEHQALLNEIYALEDALFYLQKEQVI